MSSRRRRQKDPAPASAQGEEPPKAQSGPGALPAGLDHLLTLLTLGVLALAMVRCIVPITPNLYWENDPRHAARITDDAGKPLPGEDAILPAQFLGSSGASLLDALSITLAGLALIVHVRAGGTLRWPSIITAIIGILFCFIHARENTENALLCGGWIGAISLAIASLHLASRDRQRRWFLAALVALTVPLAVEATRFVFIDHRETVEYFMKDEDAALAARGWQRGSPEHLMYLRRMQFNEPTGAFTFSNILASVTACLTMLSTCLAIGLFIKRRELPWRWLLPAALAAIGAWTVFLTHSKGAPVALVMCASLVVIALAPRLAPFAVKLARAIPLLAVALVTLAILAVIVRGMMGPPPTAEGERSILFRWHYWQATSRIVTQSPGSAAIGVGPSRFSDDYHWAKNPINPEDVRSAHNVFVDYIADLGVGGIALSALLITWLYGAARLAASHLDEPAPEPGLRGLSPSHPIEATTSVKPLHVDGIDLAFTILFLVVLFGTEMSVRGASYGTPGRFLIWSAGMTGAFFTLAVLVSKGWLPDAWSRFALFAAAAVLLVHNQIEMSFFQTSSTPLVWMIVGAAAANARVWHGQAAARGGLPVADIQGDPPRAIRSEQRPARATLQCFPGVAFIVIAIVFALSITSPVARQQSILADAEVALRTQSWNGFNQSLDLLDRAARITPANPKAFEWRSRLAMEVAASMSAQLNREPPSRIAPQARANIRELVALSLKTLDDAVLQGLNSPSIHRQRAQMLDAAAEILGEPKHRDAAVDAWKLDIDRRPYAWQDRVELADLLWRMDRKEEAKQHYAKAIELSDAMYLEPTRMMAAIERARVEKRIAE